jgi:hypothetical protein
MTMKTGGISSFSLAPKVERVQTKINYYFRFCSNSNIIMLLFKNVSTRRGIEMDRFCSWFHFSSSFQSLKCSYLCEEKS